METFKAIRRVLKGEKAFRNGFERSLVENEVFLLFPALILLGLFVLYAFFR